MSIQKWKLLSKKVVLDNKWFPVEERTYQLPDGKIIDDFTVTTLGDVAMMVAITKDNKVVLVRQYKPGADEIMIQLPAGRVEANHADMRETARHELEEETGIKVAKDRLRIFAKLRGFSTKATEKVYYYFVDNCEFNSHQDLDPTEEIEVLTVSFEEMDRLIESGEISCAMAIAGWGLAKKKFL